MKFKQDDLVVLKEDEVLPVYNLEGFGDTKFVLDPNDTFMYTFYEVPKDFVEYEDEDVWLTSWSHIYKGGLMKEPTLTGEAIVVRTTRAVYQVNYSMVVGQEDIICHLFPYWYSHFVFNPDQEEMDKYEMYKKDIEGVEIYKLTEKIKAAVSRDSVTLDDAQDILKFVEGL